MSSMLQSSGSTLFTKTNVDSATNTQGVYTLFEGGSCTYVGSSSVSIRSRLQSHQSGTEGSCTKNAASFKTEMCSNPLTRERELINEHERTYGRKPKCNDI